MTEWRWNRLVITRGRDGMVAFEKNAEPVTIPIYGSDQVVDVTGRRYGDCNFHRRVGRWSRYGFRGAPGEHCGRLVVMKRGTATVSDKELMAAIDQYSATIHS